MKRLSRHLNDSRLLIIGIISMILMAILVPLLSPEAEGPPYSIRNSDERGLMVLRRWLQQADYDVREIVSDNYRLNEYDAIFVMNPRERYSTDQAVQVRNWVQRGNTLIVSGNQYNVNNLLEAFDVQLAFTRYAQQAHYLTSPTLIRPPIPVLNVRYALYEVASERADLTMHIADGNEPLVVSFPEGAGTVWVIGSIYPFTNEGIQDDGSPELILNLLNEVPQHATIGFDESVNREIEASSQSLIGWVMGSNLGRGIALASGITFVYLLLRGRRFGAPIPFRADQLRREPVEYIRALSNLMRRSGQRDYVLHHYRTTFRRKLAARYGVPADLAPDAMSHHIATRDPNVDEYKLHTLLQGLQQQRLSERDLLHIAEDVDKWIRKHL